MRKFFTIAGLAAALAFAGGTMTAAPAYAGGGGGNNHHHGHHYNGYYWGFGGLGAGLALGYALNAYAQPQVQYVPVAPAYYPYAPAYPYYYAPAPVAPYAPYPAVGVTIVP